MRALWPAAAVLVLAGCGSAPSTAPAQTGPPTSPAATPSATAAVTPTATGAPSAPITSPGAPATVGAASGPCRTLLTAQVTLLLGTSGQPSVRDVAGIPACQWHDGSGRFVQAAQVDAATWSRSLPQAVKMLESSGVTATSADMRKLRAAADLIQQGRTVDSRRACALFSQMLEVAGEKPGTARSVRFLPDQTRPIAVAGQACVGGTYTTVMLASPNGPLDASAAPGQVTAVLNDITGG